MGVASSAVAAPVFKITLDGKVATAPVSGRVVVMLITPTAKLPAGTSPMDAPFWEDIQPLGGADVRALAPGAATVIDEKAEWIGGVPADFPAGEYQAAAVFIADRTDYGKTSSWRNDAGNYFSEVTTFTLPADAAARAAAIIDISLSKQTIGKLPAAGDGVEFVEVPSKLLSDFHKTPVVLRAGVVKPRVMAEGQKYAAIYEVPGFGGRHDGANRVARDRKRAATGVAAQLADSTFYIVLDPESPNGHTLFADSANNGPWGAALTTELIPALEKRFALEPRAEARLLRGHSSGGWSTVWLQLMYPSVFGAAWSTAPDPIDFRGFQRVDIYGGGNFYEVGPDFKPFNELEAAFAKDHGYPSYRRGKDPATVKPIMGVRQEVSGENMFGPRFTSGKQWASWLAVWGARDVADARRPAPLFDPATGVIDAKIVEQYRAYDIGHLTRTSPEKYLPIWDGRIRLVCGSLDNFYLNQAVELVKADLEKLRPAVGAAAPAGAGYVKLVANLDHSSISGSAEVRAFPQEMADHLIANGLLAQPAPAAEKPEAVKESK